MTLTVKLILKLLSLESSQELLLSVLTHHGLSQESFLVGIQEVRAGLTQAGRTIASKVASTSSTKASGE
jgi:hypothetical protein